MKAIFFIAIVAAVTLAASAKSVHHHTKHAAPAVVKIQEDLEEPIEETDAPIEETDAPSTEPAVTEGPTTTEVTTEGVTTEGTTEPASTEPPTTQEPERPPQEGDSCDPDLCKTVGYCQSYLRCDKDSGKWVREECGQDLAWNPEGDGAIHGGNCDLWENIPESVESAYRSDEECLSCFWRETGACERDYLYQAPGLTHRKVETLSCADGLVFSASKETCQRPEDVDGCSSGEKE